MIDIESLVNHQNARFLIINLLNSSNNWLANVFVNFGIFKDVDAMRSAVNEYIKTLYRLRNIYGLTKQSYSDFLLTDKDLPSAVIAYLLNSCLTNCSDNFFQIVCALYIALEGKEFEYENYRNGNNLTETLYLFLISQPSYLEHREMAVQ